jgi:two-component sensor histidine kinase
VEVAVSGGESGVVVRVTDDGVGLPPDFDLERSSSLGLSIVRTLVGELGGSLRIGSSEESSGTTVELTLP